MKKIEKIAILLTENDIGPLTLGLDCSCPDNEQDFYTKVECMKKALKKHCKEEELK